MYFTPDIEDIRVGYECEALWCCQEPRPWLPIIVTQDDNMDTKSLPIEEIYLRIQNGEIRVPYLTKEQIEAEGWKKMELYNNPNRVPFEKGNFVLVLDTRAEIPMIEMIFRDPSLYETLPTPERFHLMMDCKCINTFRTICKLLHV